MAQFWTSLAPGATMEKQLFPAGYSAQTTIEDAIDGQGWVVTLFGTGRAFLLPDGFPEISTSSDVELFFSVRQPVAGATGGFGVGVGISNGANGVVLGLTNAPSIKYHVARWLSAGANAALVGFAPADSPFGSTPVQNTFKHGRFQFLGDGTVRGRMWDRDAQSEPTAWPLSIGGQGSITGRAGLFLYQASTPAYCDFIGVGTHGDPAPSGPPAPPAGTRLRVPLLLMPF